MKVLLSFDAHLNISMDEGEIENYAKKLAESKGNELARWQIYVLLKTRMRWQSKTAQTLQISFQRILQVMEYALNNIHGGEDKTGALFFGMTGHGKSTLVNYLCGVDYQLEKISSKRRVVAQSSEWVKTSSSTNSETLLPQVVQPKDCNFVLVDLPGFEDTRGKAEQICAAISVSLLAKKLNLILALPLVCSWSALEQSKMLDYRCIAYQMGAIISAYPKACDQVFLVVTKCDADLKEEDVRARLQELAKSEGFFSQSQTEFKQENTTPDKWEKDCIRMTTQAILARKDSIILADVTTPNTRESFQKLFTGLTKKALSPNQLNLNLYNRFLQQFQQVIEDLLGYFIITDKLQETLSNAVRKNDRLLKDIEFNAKSQTEKIAILSKQNIFEQESFVKRIQNIQSTIAKLKEKKCLLSNDEKKFKETYNRDQSEIAEVKLRLKRDHELIQEEAAAAIRRGCSPQEVNAAVKEAKELIFCMYPSDDHCDQLLKASSNTLTNCQKSLWAVSDELRSHECLLVQEEMNWQNAKAVFESKANITLQEITVINKNIVAMKSQMELLLKKQKEIEQDIFLVKMEQSVNQDLFEKVYGIITALGFNSPVIKDFTQRFVSQLQLSSLLGGKTALFQKPNVDLKEDGAMLRCNQEKQAVKNYGS